MYATLRTFEITLDTSHGFRTYDSVYADSPQEAEIKAVGVFCRETAYTGLVRRAIRSGSLTQRPYSKPEGISWL